MEERQNAQKDAIAGAMNNRGYACFPLPPLAEVGVAEWHHA